MVPPFPFVRVSRGWGEGTDREVAGEPTEVSAGGPAVRAVAAGGTLSPCAQGVSGCPLPACRAEQRPSGTGEPPWAAGTGGGIAATSQKAPAVVNTAHGAAGNPVKVTSLCAHAARPVWASQLLSWGRCGGCRCLSLAEPRSRRWLGSAVFPGCVQGSPLARESSESCVTPSSTSSRPRPGWQLGGIRFSNESWECRFCCEV